VLPLRWWDGVRTFAVLVNPRRHIATRVILCSPHREIFVIWYCLFPIPDSAKLSSQKAFTLPWQRKQTPSRIEDATSSNPSQIGLRTIVEPPSHGSSNPPLNIVFVHGLGGSAVGTWTAAESNSFWPSWLSKVKGLENARIMTFGYDSGWNKIWKPNNVLDISDFAKQLVHELWCHYSDYGDVIVRITKGI